MRTALIYILLVTPATAHAPPTVDAVSIISGAILAQGFDQPDLDSRIWNRASSLHLVPVRSYAAGQARSILASLRRRTCDPAIRSSSRPGMADAIHLGGNRKTQPP